MINHVVYFKFTQNAAKDEIKKHMDMFEEISKSIPGVVSYWAGETFKVSYENTADYDTVHCLSYKTKEDLEKYASHPNHKDFIEENKAIWADVLVVNAIVPD